MCGIFAYSGSQNAGKQVLSGLKRLEYRGYDSWGIAVTQRDEIQLHKQVGKIDDIENIKLDLPKTNIAVGHTRWATHGGVSQINSHPHIASDGSFVVVQNGIVQNYLELKKELINKKYLFHSETDTEVIVRLIESIHSTEPDFIKAVSKSFKMLEGRNTIAILRKNGDLIAARNGSPLVIGINHTTGEIFLSSDTLSFAKKVEKMIVLDNNQMAYLHNNDLQIIDLKTNKKIDYKEEDLDCTDTKIDKEGFDHFMIKEINETPNVIHQVISKRYGDYQKLASAIKEAKNVYVIGSGTAGNAAAQIAFYLRRFAHIKATNLIGAEAVDYFDLFSKDDLLIAPSQSGETADVLEVLEIAKSKGAKLATYVNMQGSTMSRMADYPFLTQAGPEICVMSTKIFSSQIAWGYLLAKTVQGKYEEGVNELRSIAEEVESYLEDKHLITPIKKMAQEMINHEHIFLLGKFQNLQIIREGMIKIVESSYIHAHAMPAGDLKHYAITIMEPGVPVVLVVSEDEVKSDVINAAHEVKARGASVIGIANKNDQSFNQHIKIPFFGEACAIGNIIPLQLLAYYMAVELGNDVDHPRNIAKSVTVK